MNYKIKVVASFLVMLFLHGCAENTLKVADKDEAWKSHGPMLVMNENFEEEREDKLNALKLLDATLSPFEDMTEYALESDDIGMNKTLKTIHDNQNRYPNFKNEVKQLELSVMEHNYKTTALLSTQLFKKSIDDFTYANYVKEQIHIENLDYLGFEILSLVNQTDIDYVAIQKLIMTSKQHWLAIRDKINDENSIDSFNLLFRGLEISVKNQDTKMLKVLAHMDLSLVDIIEKFLQ